MQQTCEDCSKFRRHYIKQRRGTYSKLDMGHCVLWRHKYRQSKKEACESFCKILTEEQ